MENLKDRYIKLLQDKLDALRHMRNVTVAQVFTGDESLVEKEAEAFIALYEERSRALERVEKINDALELLDPLDADDLSDMAFQSKVMEFRQNMVELAREMAMLDKANIIASQKITTYMKGSLKQTRQSLDLIQGYDDYIDANEGHFMDKKKL